MVLPATLLIGPSTDLLAVLVGVGSRLARLHVLLYLGAAELGIRAVYKVCVTMLLEAHFDKPVLVELPLQVIFAICTGHIIVLVERLIAQFR